MKYLTVLIKRQAGGQILPQAAPTPTVPTLTIPATDFTGFQQGQAAMARIQQAVLLEEARQQQGQRADDARRKAFLDLRAKMGIPVHNEAQQKVIDTVFEEAGIRPEDTAAVDLNNPFQIKDMERKMQLAVSDPRFLRVVGEIEAADRLRLLATDPSKLNSEEYLAWDESWTQYRQHSDPSQGFDLNKLSPTRYKTPPTPATPKPYDFGKTFDSTIDTFDDIDINNPDDVKMVEQAIMTDLLLTNQQAAVHQGLLELEEDDEGNIVNVRVNPLITQDVLNSIAANQRGGKEVGAGTGVVAAEARELLDSGEAETFGEALDIIAQREGSRRRAKGIGGGGGGSSASEKARFGNSQAGIQAEAFAQQLEAVGVEVDTSLTGAILGVFAGGGTSDNARDARQEAVEEIVRENVDVTGIRTPEQLQVLTRILDININVNPGGVGLSKTQQDALAEELTEIYDGRQSPAQIRDMIRRVEDSRSTIITGPQAPGGGTSDNPFLSK